MKSYPLNPFADKFVNWTHTYLQELNTKIWALKNYSDFFLTDYIQDTLEYSETFVVKNTQGQNKVLKILNLATLPFHCYAYVDIDCYLETESTDENAVRYESVTGEIKYLRPIPAGTMVISNARPEGSIDANGILEYLLRIWVSDPDPDLPDEPGEEDILTATRNSSEVALTFSYPEYGPAHPDRTNWRNFTIQPTGFASLYSIEPTESGLIFQFYEKGGEEYGTTLNLILLFQHARYEYLGKNDALTFTQYNNGITLYSYSNTGQFLIATKVITDGQEAIVPWLARSNPLMFCLYKDRQREDGENAVVYGEEIITDATFEVGATKLETVNTLRYTINMKETLPSVLSFTAEVL